MNPEIARQRVSSLSDDDVAEIADARANPQSVKRDDPTPEGHTPVMEKFDQLIDRIAILENAIVGMFASKKDRNKLKFRPVPRPKTAFDKFVDELVFSYEKQEADDLKKMVGF